MIENNNQLNMDSAANSSRAFCKLPKILFVDEDLRQMSLETHNLSPRVSENETQESQNMRPNKTDQSKTDPNKTKRSNSFSRGMVSCDDHRTAEEELAEILAEQGILYPLQPSDTQPSGEEGIIEQ